MSLVKTDFEVLVLNESYFFFVLTFFWRLSEGLSFKGEYFVLIFHNNYKGFPTTFAHQQQQMASPVAMNPLPEVRIFVNDVALVLQAFWDLLNTKLFSPFLQTSSLARFVHVLSSLISLHHWCMKWHTWVKSSWEVYAENYFTAWLTKKKKSYLSGLFVDTFYFFDQFAQIF